MEKHCVACGLKNNVLFETPHWTVVLNSRQYYVGRSLVILKRHAEQLSDLTQEEWKDLHQAISHFEHGIKRAFPITLLNWTCLMNNAYREKPFNPHVHFHVTPRHEKPITFAGETWTDEVFGEHYNRVEGPDASPELLSALESKLKTAFNS